MAKNRAGFKEEVKALLHRHGADRLPDIDSSEYAALVVEAEGAWKWLSMRCSAHPPPIGG